MPAFASVPSPTTSSTTCRSWGGAPSGKSISGRCRWVSAIVSSCSSVSGRCLVWVGIGSVVMVVAILSPRPVSGPGAGSAGVEDVDDEDEGVRAADAEAVVTRGAVAFDGRHHEQPAAAYRRPDQAAVEPADHLRAPDGDGGGLPAPPRGVELPAAGPDDAGVLHAQLLPRAHLRPSPHDERLDDEVV